MKKLTLVALSLVFALPFLTGSAEACPDGKKFRRSTGHGAYYGQPMRTRKARRQRFMRGQRYRHQQRYQQMPSYRPGRRMAPPSMRYHKGDYDKSRRHARRR